MRITTREVLLVLTLAGIAGMAVLAPASERPAGWLQLASYSRGMNPSLQRVADQGGIGVGLGIGTGNQFLGRDTLGDAKADPFGSRSWRAPPKPIAAPPAAPPIPAPPPRMVYRFAGRLVQDGKLQIFVSKGDTPIVVNVGDILEGGYVVQGMTPAAIELIYPQSGHRVDIVIPQVISTAASTPPANAIAAPGGLRQQPNLPAVHPPVPSTHSQPQNAVPFNPASRLR